MNQGDKDYKDFVTRESGTYWGEEGKKFDKMFEFKPEEVRSRPNAPSSGSGSSKPLFPFVDAFFNRIPGWVAGVFAIVGLLIGATLLSEHALVGGFFGAIAGGLLLPIARLSIKLLLMLVSFAILLGLLALALKIIGALAAG